jgi:hypothetical protein
VRLKDLYEGLHAAPLRTDLTDTLPPTYVIPDLQNNDSYVQYRYLVALAAAEAIERGEIDMAQASTWNEMTSVVCYTPAEETIVKDVNKHMGVYGKKISKTPSKEPTWVNRNSPVRTFKDLDR